MATRRSVDTGLLRRVFCFVITGLSWLQSYWKVSRLILKFSIQSCGPKFAKTIFSHQSEDLGNAHTLLGFGTNSSEQRARAVDMARSKTALLRLVIRLCIATSLPTFLSRSFKRSEHTHSPEAIFRSLSKRSRQTTPVLGRVHVITRLPSYFRRVV